jgi:hypothetical protein
LWQNEPMKPLAVDSLMVFQNDLAAIANASAPDVATPGLQLSARPGHEVQSYLSLLKKIAALSYYNPRFRLLFRGQAEDYVVNTKGEPGTHSSLYPAILRSTGGRNRSASLHERFEALAIAEEKLKKALVTRDVHRDRLVRWAILQHYEVVPTPLLDVTQSLQAALSFALMDDRDEGYLFVLAVPQLTGPISVSIESETQVIDLAQTCPPEALRPHFQSGMLVGDYPVIDSVQSSHGGKGMIGNNFACRLIGKFKLVDCRNWPSEGFVATSRDLLFPDTIDVWCSALSDIRKALSVP